MKTTKKTTTKTTKKTKPTFVVDLTNAESYKDVKIAFIAAKVNAGVAITKSELAFVISEAMTTGALVVLDTMEEFFAKAKVIEADEKQLKKFMEAVKELENPVEDEKPVEPKKPWYKRFWNWLTRKN